MDICVYYRQSYEHFRVHMNVWTGMIKCFSGCIEEIISPKCTPKWWTAFSFVLFVILLPVHARVNDATSEIARIIYHYLYLILKNVCPTFCIAPKVQIVNACTSAPVARRVLQCKEKFTSFNNLTNVSRDFVVKGLKSCIFKQEKRRF